MKISVITPSYNSAIYIERAIKSVLNQDYKNWEHLIIDGESTDETVHIVKKFPHLKWISEKDEGQSDAMNKGLKICTGEIIVFLNSDDEFEPNIFKYIIEVFNKNDADVIVGNGKTIFENKETKEWKPVIVLRKLVLYYKYDWPFNPVSYFCKKNVYQLLNYNKNNHFTMDYEFLLNLYANFKIKKVPVFFGNFYMYSSNKSATINTDHYLHLTLKEFCKKNNQILFLYYLIARKINHYNFRIKQILKIGN